MFSKAEGGIASLCYDGVEYITRTPKLTFWRALTDNDRGAKTGFDAAQWMTAGLFYKLTDVDVQEQKDQVCVTFEYLLPTVPQTKAYVSYRVTGDGKIHVHALYKGTDGLPEMPAFGMDMKLKARYDRVRYYGRGPEENYLDRREGARLGVYSYQAADNLSAYLFPQECGNRMDVRWVEVTDADGQGLRFETEGVLLKTVFFPAVLTSWRRPRTGKNCRKLTTAGYGSLRARWELEEMTAGELQCMRNTDFLRILTGI